jgi:hypothetical protein
MQGIISKKGPKALSLIAVCYDNHYLFITYIVTSKPNLISVAAGFVHIVVLLLCCIFTKLRRSYAYIALFAIQGLLVKSLNIGKEKPGLNRVNLVLLSKEQLSAL